MKIRIDFSLFATPTSAFGNVNGFMEVSVIPKVGDRIGIAGHEFRVEDVRKYGSVNKDRIMVEKGITVSLDDLVLSSREEAKEYVARLEEETELGCDEYE